MNNGLAWVIIIGIPLLFIGIIIYAIDASDKNKKIVSESSKKLIDEYDKVVVLNDVIMNNGIFPYVAFDNKNKKVAIQQRTLPLKEINYDDIVGVELIQDGSSTMSIGSVVGGGLLAGDVGMIIGSMNRSDAVNNLSLKISINDFNAPSYEIIMIEGTKIKKSDKAYTESIQKLTEVMDTIKYIINNKQNISNGGSTNEINS